MTQPNDSIDARVLKALSHPTRLAILRMLERGEASPAQAARELDITVEAISYHFKKLAELGLIELARTSPKRGATEHHYVTKARAVGHDRASCAANRPASADGLVDVVDALTRSATPGGLNEEHNRISRTLELRLDRRGLAAAVNEIDKLERRLRDIQDQSRQRVQRSGKPTTAIRTSVIHVAKPVDRDR